MLNYSVAELRYILPIFAMSNISLKKKSTGKDLWIQWQNTVGNVLIDNLKPDAFERFLKAFCNIIKIVEHTAHFLGKRNITMCKVM